MSLPAEQTRVEPSHIQAVPPQETLTQLLLGVPVLQMIHAGVQLGVYDAIGDEIVASEVVAAACGGQPDATHRLLRALSVVGLVVEHNNRRFSLTPVGQLLRPGVIGSFEPLARLNGSAWFGDAYAQLAHSVRTGQSGFSKVHGQPLFDWLSERPAESATFGRGMSTFSGVEVDLILAHYDFSRCRHLVDVGGGHGLLLWKILQAVPEARGTLFDTPATLAQGEGILPQAVSARCERVGGSFFESIPSGGDTYLLKHILHDWSDEKAAAIVGNVSEAMPSGAQLVVLEQGIAQPGIPNPGKIMDVLMLSLLDGGRERTVDEHAALMGGAGIAFEREISTRGPLTLFVGRKK